MKQKNKQPKKTLIKSFENFKNKKNLKTHKTVDSLFKELNGKKKTKLSEHQLQSQIVSYLALKHYFYFQTDVMSGLQYFNHKDPRRYAFIQHHKNMGYRKGQPDLVVIFKGKVIFLELKTDNGKQSKEQKEVEKEIKDLGYEYHIVRNLDDLSIIFGIKNA